MIVVANPFDRTSSWVPQPLKPPQFGAFFSIKRVLASADQAVQVPPPMPALSVSPLHYVGETAE